MFNFLLISFIIFIIISILFLTSFYLFIKESKQKIKICKSNKDCNNGEMCWTDIYTNKWCYKPVRKLPSRSPRRLTNGQY